MNGLDVDDKRQRVASFHKETLKSVAEILAAAGLTHSRELSRRHVFRRISQTQTCSYQQIYPPLEVGSLLAAPYPEHYAEEMELANAEMFNHTVCDVD